MGDQPILYPDDPCLDRLAQSIELRTRVGVGLSTTFSAPVELTEDQQHVSGCNTGVTLTDASDGGSVDIRYSRTRLATLANHYGDVVLSFGPEGNVNRQALVDALSRHYKRRLGVRDLTERSYTTISKSPNGKYTMLLEAAPDSYGWVGQHSATLVVRADIGEVNIVTKLDGFVLSDPT